MAEDNLAGVLVVALHVHAALLKKLLEDKERGMDVLDSVILEAPDSLSKHLVHPFLLHLLVALTDDLETGTDGFARGGPDEMARVS